MKVKINIRDLLVNELGESVHIPAILEIDELFEFSGSFSQELELDKLLEENRMIAHVWTVADVRELRPDLNEDQAWRVLQACNDHLDSEHGITHDTIDQAASDLFGSGTAFRADRCEKALCEYGDAENAETSLTDFLADARHWCDEHGHSFADLDRLAYQHYAAERNDKED